MQIGSGAENGRVPLLDALRSLYGLRGTPSVQDCLVALAHVDSHVDDSDPYAYREQGERSLDGAWQEMDAMNALLYAALGADCTLARLQLDTNPDLLPQAMYKLLLDEPAQRAAQGLPALPDEAEAVLRECWGRLLALAGPERLSRACALAGAAMQETARMLGIFDEQPSASHGGGTEGDMEMEMAGLAKLLERCTRARDKARFGSPLRARKRALLEHDLVRYAAMVSP